MSIRIRRAEPNDVPAMSRVLIASITELCVADHHNDEKALAAWTANKSQAGVAEMLENSDLHVFVAELDDRVVAVGALTSDGQIALNYVAPEARFQGVSRTLLSRLENELVALGLTEGRLEATQTACRFYKTAGWSLDGPQASGRNVNGFPMRKTLAN